LLGDTDCGGYSCNGKSEDNEDFVYDDNNDGIVMMMINDAADTDGGGDDNDK